MSRNIGKGAARGRRKSRASLLWIAASALVVIVLLYLEQVAMLYVLATLSVASLLGVVALADLRGARVASDAPAPRDDSAAIADGTTGGTTVATSFGPGRSRQRR